MLAQLQNLMANSRHRRFMACAMLMYCLMPLGASSTSRADEWPELLAPASEAVEPSRAMLQLRANVTLARLVEAGRAVD